MTLKCFVPLRAANTALGRARVRVAFRYRAGSLGGSWLVWKNFALSFVTHYRSTILARLGFPVLPPSLFPPQLSSPFEHRAVLTPLDYLQWLPSQVVSLGAGYNHATAVTEDGKLFMWGMKVRRG